MPIAPAISFSYVKTANFRLLLVAGPLLLALEEMIIRASLGTDQAWLKGAHTVGSIAAVAWIWGQYFAMRARPHRLEGAWLFLHRGLGTALQVPLSDVATVGRITDEGDPFRPQVRKDTLRWTVAGPPQVEITLRTPLERPVRKLVRRSGAAVTRVVISVDDPPAFCQAVAWNSKAARR